MNHMLEKKIINGSNLIIKLGTKMLDKINGLKILAFDSLFVSQEDGQWPLLPHLAEHFGDSH